MLLSTAHGTAGSQIRLGIVSSVASEHLMMHFEVRRRTAELANRLGGVSPDEPRMRPHQGVDGAISIGSISFATWPTFLRKACCRCLEEIDKMSH